MNVRSLLPLMLLALIAPLGGCQLPAQIEWSPDGSRAAYRAGDKAILIDEQGKVVRELGTSQGGFAWSEDSQKLYFAGAGEAVDPKSFERREGWRSALPATRPATTQPGEAQQAASDRRMVVSVLEAGRVSALFDLAAPVLHMALSPDQQWLAVMTFDDKRAAGDEHDPRLEVFAYSIAARRLYPLTVTCSPGMCFTGAARLSFTEPDLAPDGTPMPTGHLVEVILDDGAEQLVRKPRLEVMPGCTPWLRSIGDVNAGEMLVVSSARKFPSPDPQRDPPFHLYRFTRADSGLAVIAEDVGLLCTPSPNGKRILYEKITRGPEGEVLKRHLMIINANGSDPRVLRDLTRAPSRLPVLWPTWRTDDEIVLTSLEGQADATDPSTTRFEVILYRISDAGELEPLRTLSQEWAPELKPSHKPASAPTMTTTTTQPSAAINPP